MAGCSSPYRVKQLRQSETMGLPVALLLIDDQQSLPHFFSCRIRVSHYFALRVSLWTLN
jgi:hypothetical protein